MELVIIDFSNLRIADDLTRFVEALQSKIVCGKILVRIPRTWTKAHELPNRLYGLLKLPLCGVYNAQPIARCGYLGVVLNLLLKRLCRFIEFPGYIVIVARSDRQLFPLTGMFPQLECLGEVLTGSPWFVERRVGSCPRTR